MGPTPCYSQSLVVSACQHFMPVAPLFGQSTTLASSLFFFFFFFFLYRKGCGHIDIFMMFPGDTNSKYIYGIVGVAQFLYLVKVPT